MSRSWNFAFSNEEVFRFVSHTVAVWPVKYFVFQVDKVENNALNLLFDFKMVQLHCSSPRKMFQRIPAQFCEMVCHIGFHAEYAPPEGMTTLLQIAFNNANKLFTYGKWSVSRVLKLQLYRYSPSKLEKWSQQRHWKNSYLSCKSPSVHRPSIWRGHLLCWHCEKGHGSVEGAKRGVSVLCGSRRADRKLHPW